MKTCPFCAESIQNAAVVCKHCGRDLVGDDAPKSATANNRKSFAGAGCGLQGLGVVSLIAAAVSFSTIVGPIVFGLLGLWLIAYGSRRSQWFECSNCGTKLAHKDLVQCPSCGSRMV